MLIEERHSIILQYLQEHRTATITELNKLIKSSEATLRRDLRALSDQGLLKKVHGGATCLDNNRYITHEDDVITKNDLFTDEKRMIARGAAAMIAPDDFVYIDAGTTTIQMIEYITEKHAVFVTNGIVHAMRLIQQGFNTYILGGNIKGLTEAVIGTEAYRNLANYNFTKGFFGTNGISSSTGYTTGEFSEANVKREAMRHCHDCFVLADNSKFKQVFPVTFGQLEQATIITDRLPDTKYKKYTEIIEVNARL